MTKQESASVLEAIENGWNDRIFVHYQIWVNSTAVRPQDDESWSELVDELKAKVTPKESKTITTSSTTTQTVKIK